MHAGSLKLSPIASWEKKGKRSASMIFGRRGKTGYKKTAFAHVGRPLLIGRKALDAAHVKVGAAANGGGGGSD